ARRREDADDVQARLFGQPLEDGRPGLAYQIDLVGFLALGCRLRPGFLLTLVALVALLCWTFADCPSSQEGHKGRQEEASPSAGWSCSHGIALPKSCDGSEADSVRSRASQVMILHLDRAECDRLATLVPHFP